MTIQIECDGCSAVVDIEEWQWDSDDPIENLPRCSCGKHWGWMKVGSQSWFDYHDEGIHPMSNLKDSIEQLYNAITNKDN